jgi:glutathione synthase/RimK-type ligase-like ATP-grasp enzyme
MQKVLILTNAQDPSVRGVIESLCAMGVPYVRFNMEDILTDLKFNFRVDSEYPSWFIGKPGSEIGSDEVASVWYRRPFTPKAPLNTGDQFKDFVENEAQKTFWSLWTIGTSESILWVNHPLRLKLLEYNKPYQLAVAAASGISIPKTLITTCFDEALKFFDECGGNVVVKVFGGNKLRDKEGRLMAVYTNRILRTDLIAGRNGFSQSPVMLESYVPKAFELRVTAVGNELFACAIHSQDSKKTKDDWRHYDFEHVKHEAYQLPLHVQQNLVNFMKRCGIHFGAIDMVVTPQGDHVFLEVNPSGQWGWVERLAKAPISRSLAELLAQPDRLRIF